MRCNPHDLPVIFLILADELIELEQTPDMIDPPCAAIFLD
jgi:hypothetical protein